MAKGLLKEFRDHSLLPLNQQSMGLVLTDAPPSFKKGSSGGTPRLSQGKSLTLRRRGAVSILHLIALLIYSRSCYALRYSTSNKYGANHLFSWTIPMCDGGQNNILNQRQARKRNILK